MNLFRKKDIAHLAQDAEKSGFVRNLTAFDLVFLGIGSVIGTGIFVLTGVGAALYAGPGIAISFILASVACAFAGLAYAEYSSMVPVSGSAYAYTYASLGEFMAFLVGWNLILEYTVTCSTVAAGWSGYVVGLLTSGGLNLSIDFLKVPAEGGIINLPAVFITMFLCILLVRGTKESIFINRILVFVKIAVIFIFLCLAIPNIDVRNWEPFLPFGYQGIASGAAIVFFAYIGFDAVSTTAQVTKNPQRDLPIGIIGSLVVATVLYIAVSFVIVGIVPYEQLGVPDPMAVTLNVADASLSWLKPLIKIGAIAGLSTVVLVSLLGQPRIMYAMSRDGLLPKWCGELHPRLKTPYISTIVSGAVGALIAGLFPIDILGELVSIGTLLAFLIVCIGVQVLRYVHPEIERPFKVPFAPLIPICGAVTVLFLMLTLPSDTWWRLMAWMVLGIIVYFSYSIKHSLLRSKK